ncbi:ABC transporter permease [Bifidobacterium reuteri]|uniref:ABC transporter permease n=1 Tax=Bifidobacterium reuteri TaxID=983706 RepID=A0A5J5E8K7_9BIFI|nr:ABC transporter permease [Bifidobacterium reuteri]KAA8825634.1 ABC transporter permease [Bifidobacterium reuteri]
MNTCKATLRVLIAHRLYIIIYLVLIGIMMFTISAFQLKSGTEIGDTFAPDKPSVAVVDRDADRGHIAGSLRAYLAPDHELVDVDDQPETLQRAVASNWVDLIVIIPQGYADDMLASVESGEDAPAVETVTSFRSGAGSMASMSVSGFLSMLRTTLIGGNVTVDAADWATLYGAYAGSSDSGDGQTTTSHGSLDMLPEGRIADLGLNDVSEAAERVEAVSRDKAANHAIAVDHSDAPATQPDAATEAVKGLGVTMKTMLYPLFVAMTVCTALVLGVFNAGETRRRLFASPQRSSLMGVERMATMCMFALIVVVIYLLATVGLMIGAGLDPTEIDPAGAAMTLLAACVYALMTVACGFLLGECGGVGETMANGFANVFGLLILFTSGVALPLDMIPAPMLAIGRMLPGWWYCAAIDDALGIGTAADSGVSVTGWASSIGIVALFAVTFVCIGLAVGRWRRTRPAPVGASTTQLA